MNPESFSLIEAYMRSCMDAAAHDVLHVYRVLQNARAIAAGEENVDLDVLEAAALLHDVGRPAQLKDPAVDHAEVGADMAFAFLTGHGFSDEFAAKVRHCVYTHRFRKSRPPETIEAKILFDADKLDATGAIGLARTLVYNGQVDRPLYASDEHGNAKLDENEESPSFFREYHFKLKHLYDRFYTKTGAALAAGRRKAAEDFIAALEEEIG